MRGVVTGQAFVSWSGVLCISAVNHTLGAFHHYPPPPRKRPPQQLRASSNCMAKCRKKIQRKALSVTLLYNQFCRTWDEGLFGKPHFVPWNKDHLLRQTTAPISPLQANLSARPPPLSSTVKTISWFETNPPGQPRLRAYDRARTEHTNSDLERTAPAHPPSAARHSSGKEERKRGWRGLDGREV